MFDEIGENKNWGYFSSTVQITLKHFPHWQYYLPDDTLLSELYLPGTHQSENNYGIRILDSDFDLCQTLSVRDQFYLGIRVFDGVGSVSIGVLEDLLKYHPEEFVIVLGGLEKLEKVRVGEVRGKIIRGGLAIQSSQDNVNNRWWNALVNNKRSHEEEYGRPLIQLFDFPGPDLVEKIIRLNNRNLNLPVFPSRELNMCTLYGEYTPVTQFVDEKLFSETVQSCVSQFGVRSADWVGRYWGYYTSHFHDYCELSAFVVSGLLVLEKKDWKYKSKEELKEPKELKERKMVIIHYGYGGVCYLKIRIGGTNYFATRETNGALRLVKNLLEISNPILVNQNQYRVYEKDVYLVVRDGVLLAVESRVSDSDHFVYTLSAPIETTLVKQQMKLSTLREECVKKLNPHEESRLSIVDIRENLKNLENGHPKYKFRLADRPLLPLTPPFHLPFVKYRLPNKDTNITGNDSLTDSTNFYMLTSKGFLCLSEDRVVYDDVFLRADSDRLIFQTPLDQIPPETEILYTFQKYLTWEYLQTVTKQKPYSNKYLHLSFEKV